MKALIAQINPHIGNIQSNKNKIVDTLKRARDKKIDAVLFPELSICGYPPSDLVLFDDFFIKIEKALDEIAKHTKDFFVVIGCPRKIDKDIYNSACIISNGKIMGYKDKSLIPSYNVFNEKRYFKPSLEQKVFEYKNKKIGILISEDIWGHASDITKIDYDFDPVEKLKKLKPDLVFVLSASPYYFEKIALRLKVYEKVAKYLSVPLLICNQVGANDELIFDGYSFYIDTNINTIAAKGFEEDFLTIDTDNKNDLRKKFVLLDPFEDLFNSLVLGTKDYFIKQGFSKACLGLSGGVDSALSLVIAAKALGSDNILALRMPSRFSSLSSIEDAEKMAKNLNVNFLDLSIDTMYQHFLDLLSPVFVGKKPDTAEENLQARIRGMILMAISNKLGYIVLSTGNKSELAMGYVTLYGDMAGGLALLSDVPKTLVYKLTHWVNKQKEIIPKNIISKPPSAELSPDQKDTDSLPPYEIVDKVLIDYLENHSSPEDIAKKYELSIDLVLNLMKKIYKAEFKRRQGPLGLVVSKKAFGRGRSLPIVQGWI